MEDLIRSIPHINVGNIQMANWQDVKITLFPDCSESNCTIVLNSLKFTLKYPLQRRNIHKCSSSERAKFLENFQIVDTGIIIVNLEDVWKNRQNLNKLVRWKHVISKDASSLNCRASQLVSNIDNVLNSSFLPSYESIAKLPDQIIWSVPHISVQGNPMASWSDIRDVLFPGCTGKNCTIVLNCLRLKLKYPLITQNIYTCSSKQQSRFLSKFQMLPKMDTIVNLKQVIFYWSCLVEMVVKKHWATKDPSSSSCTLFSLYHSISNTNNTINSTHFQGSTSELYSLRLLPFSGADGLMYNLPGFIRTDHRGQRQAYVPIHALLSVFPAMSLTVKDILRWQFHITTLNSWSNQETNWDQPVILCPRKLTAQMPDILTQTGFLCSYITSQTMLLNWTFFMRALYHMSPPSTATIPWEEKFYSHKSPVTRILKIHLSKNNANNNNNSQKRQELSRTTENNSSGKVLNYQLLLWEYQKSKQRALIFLKTTNVNNGTEAGGTPFKNWLHLTKKTITSGRSNKPTRNQLNDVNVSGNKTNDKTSQTVPISRIKTCIVATDKKNASTRPEKLNFNHKKQPPHYLPKEKNPNPQIYSSNPTSGKKSGLTLNTRSRQEKLHSKENNDSVNFLAKRKTAEKPTVPTSSSGKTSTRRVLQTYGHSERKCKVPIQNSKKMSKQKKRTRIMKNGTSLKYKKELQRNSKGILNITNNSRSRFNNKENIREVSSDVGENYSSKVNQGFINVDWKSIYPVHGSLIKAKPIKKNILMRELLKKDIGLLRETAKLVCTCRDAYRPADKAPLCRFLQQKFNTNSSHCLVHSLIVGDKPQRKMRNSDPKLESTSLEPKDNANDNMLTSTKEKLFFVRHPKKVMLDAYHRQKPEVE
ncbi:uncharacterized protein LOC106869130 [Octopus bimaculoides]|uniref:Uncharacterized protein n=1 Tax=Octopus bimaculoides TaxID=37653 RepID=A0A0L8IFA1_OCTBM|nr:uncharacterized protein LOC106869130 [Octopus bimaculoides]|eukprot:XP_014770187.1 PREDICTED: uncharacterized protein LOC106869130 [Octopus bimaculoides]